MLSPRFLCHPRVLAVAAAALGVTPLLAGCGGAPPASPVAAAAPAPAVKVAVFTVAPGEMVRKITQPGSIQGMEEATLYAKTSGYLKNITVDKGDRVRAGQLIAVVESPETLHQVEQAQAATRQALASTRGVEATRGRAVADVAQAAAAVDRARADVQEAEAKVGRAKADLARVEAQVPRLEAGAAEAEPAVRAAEEERGKAQADLARWDSEIRTAKASVQAAESALRKAEAEARLQKATFARLKGVQDKDPGLVAAQDVDVTRARAETAESEVEAAKHRIDAAQGAVAAAEQQREGARRQVAVAEQRIQAAQSHTRAAREEVQVGRKDVEAARQQVAVAEAQVRAAQTQVAAAESARRARQADVRVAEAQVGAAREQASGSRSALSAAAALAGYTRVVAPFDGVVTERLADPGAFVQNAGSNQASASGIVRLVRDRAVRVMIPVSEGSVRSVRLGQAAELAVDAYPGQKFNGRVSRFATAMDPKSRTMLTEVDIPNLDGKLRPGMYVRVTLTLETHHGALSVPSEAVMGPEDKRFVYVIDGGKAHRTPVTVGIDDGKVSEITAGLNPGAQVVVTGRDMLVDGAAVKTEPWKPAPK